MNRNTRITLTDTLQDIVIKLAGGNPGAIRVCCELYKTGASCDPDSAFGGLSSLLDLDQHSIYESRIWMLYKDVCGQDLTKTHGMLRAVQLGILSPLHLNSAIDGVFPLDPEAVLAEVQKQLPQFGRNQEVETTQEEVNDARAYPS